MRLLPQRVRRSLPPFPSKVVFNKNIVTIEKRRLAIQKFLRSLIMIHYVQKRLYLLRPINLESIPVQGQNTDSAKYENLKDLTRRTKSIAIFNSSGPNSPVNSAVNSPINSPVRASSITDRLNSGSVRNFLDAQTKVCSESPISVSSFIKSGTHRRPKSIGEYVIHGKLVDCLETHTSIYSASKDTKRFSLKLQINEIGSLENHYKIHLMVIIKYILNMLLLIFMKYS